MFLMNKENYVFMYGAEADERMKKQLKNKLLLSPVGILFSVAAVFSGLDILRSSAIGILITLLIWILPEVTLRQKCIDLRIAFKMEIPDFLDVTALLLDAGHPLWYSVETASEVSESELCKRINSVFHSAGSMDEGRSAEVMLDRLAVELKTPEVSSAIAAIVQNSRKGEKELSSVLRMQSSICRRIRKDAAEELGNKASNLLMIPTTMVFASILIMLLAPAVMQLSIF